MLKIMLLTITLVLMPLTTSAENNYKPLAETGHPTAYFVATRCGGLMLALAYWMGESPENKGLHADLTKNVQVFTAYAIQDASGGDAPTDKIRIQALEIVKASHQMYLDRFKNNYAETGQGYGEDKEVMADIILCNKIKNNE